MSWRHLPVKGWAEAIGRHHPAGGEYLRHHHRWIHIDGDRARAECPFGGPIAREMRGQQGSLSRPGGFPDPADGHLQEVIEVPGGLQITGDGVSEAQGADKPVCVAEPLFRFYR